MEESDNLFDDCNVVANGGSRDLSSIAVRPQLPTSATVAVPLSIEESEAAFLSN